MRTRDRRAGVVVIVASIAAIAGVLVGAGCGAPDVTGVGIAFEAQDAGGAAAEPARLSEPAVFTVVAAAERAFEVDSGALVDVELVDAGGARTHVAIHDAAAAGHVALADGAAVTVEMSPPCCLGPGDSSVVISDDNGLIAVAFTGGREFDELGLTLASDGGRTIAAPITCGSAYEIGVRVSGDGDDTAVLERGDTAEVGAGGVDVVVHNAGSEHIDPSCEDTRSGDVIAWTAVRSNLLP